jgi:hypothetical protein
MKSFLRRLAALGASALMLATLAPAAQAQTQIVVPPNSANVPTFAICFGAYFTACQPVDATHPLPVSATVNATVTAASPFLQLGADTAPMTTASARRALPTTDIVVLFFNPSTNATAHVKLGNTSVVAALTDIAVPPGTFVAVPNPGGVNVDYAAILESGTGNLSAWTGTGQLMAVGGGGGGSAGGLTDTQLRASAVPVSGPLTDTQLRASSVPVTLASLPAFASTPTFNLGTLNGAATAAKQPALGVVGTPSADVLTTQTADLRPSSSTITAADVATTTATGQSGVVLVSGTPTASSFQTQALNGASSASITTTGTFVATDQIEASYNGGTTYVPVKGLLRGTNILTSAITGPGVVSLDVTGATNLRVRATSYTSGTETVQIALSAAPGMTKVLNGVQQVDANGAAVDVSNDGNGLGVVGGNMPSTALAVGCRASTTTPTAAADAKNTTARCDANGNLVNWPYANPENYTTGLIATPMTSTTSTAITGMGAQGATLRNYVTEVSCQNTHASVDTLVNIQDGSAGTVIAQLFCPHVGGHQKQFPAPLRQPTLNTGLFAADAVTGASVTLSASGFKAP